MAVLSKHSPLWVEHSCYELGHTWTPYCSKAVFDVGSIGFKKSIQIYLAFYVPECIQYCLLKSFVICGEIDYLNSKYSLTERVYSDIFWRVIRNNRFLFSSPVALLAWLSHFRFLRILRCIFAKFSCIHLKSLLHTSFILRGKWKKMFTTKSFYADLIRSSIFLSTNAYLFIFDVCLFRRIFGGYHYSFGMLAGIPACAIALQIERQNRRGLLALYTANIAAETFFNMLVARGYARRIKYGEVVLFSVTSAFCMLLFKSKNLLAPDIDSMLRKFVGNEESGNAEKENHSATASKSVEVYLPKIFQKFVKVIITKLKAEPTHKLCNHTSSCLYSCVASFCRQFGIGYSIQMVFNILKSLTRLKQNPKGLLKSLYHRENFLLGAFLGLYTSTFKALCCTFRWFRKMDHPLHGLVAGFVAGLSSGFYRSTTITLYFLLKILQNLYDNCVKDGYFPTIPHGSTILYALSTSLVLQASVFEPQHIRPSYWNFLLRLTGNKFRQINRKLLDQMGTEASKLYPNDWPDYDTRFTSLKQC